MCCKDHAYVIALLMLLFVQHLGTNGELASNITYVRQLWLDIYELLQWYLNVEDYTGCNGCHYRGLPLPIHGAHSYLK
jgi:hypothetical protein